MPIWCDLKALLVTAIASSSMQANVGDPVCIPYAQLVDENADVGALIEQVRASPLLAAAVCAPIRPRVLGNRLLMAQHMRRTVADCLRSYAGLWT
jgi:hypothetical protein